MIDFVALGHVISGIVMMVIGLHLMFPKKKEEEEETKIKSQEVKKLKNGN